MYGEGEYRVKHELYMMYFTQVKDLGEGRKKTMGTWHMMNLHAGVNNYITALQNINPFIKLY